MISNMFISWEEHQRTRSICNKLQMELVEVISDKTGFMRYIECIFRTYRILNLNKPKTLIVQNPSIVLTFVSLLLRPLFRYKLVVDAHNEAINPYINTHFIFIWMSKLLIKKSDLTLVTNSVLAEKVVGLGGKPFVLPDVLPSIKPTPPLPAPIGNQPWKILLISTYAKDEPYDEVFAAMERLGDRFVLEVTGRIPRHIDSTSLPANVTLLGFLSHTDYWLKLERSHLLIDLTTMENCLVCGAYEGLSMERPILLSRNHASLELFGNYAVHVENTAMDIFNGIITLITQYELLHTAIKHAKVEFLSKESDRVNQLRKILD
jgi:hypothetical protein